VRECGCGRDGDDARESGDDADELAAYAYGDRGCGGYKEWGRCGDEWGESGSDDADELAAYPYGDRGCGEYEDCAGEGGGYADDMGEGGGYADDAGEGGGCADGAGECSRCGDGTRERPTYANGACGGTKGSISGASKRT
jgi:hypothetical protein